MQYSAAQGLTVCTHVVPFNRVLEILKRASQLPQALNTVIWLWTMQPNQSKQMCKCASRQMFSGEPSKIGFSDIVISGSSYASESAFSMSSS